MNININITEQKEKAYELQLIGRHIEARNIYQQIVTDDTEDFKLLIRYANCLDDGDNRKIPLYKKALQIGQTPWACLGLSKVFLNRDEFSLAFDYIAQAEDICSKTSWGDCETTIKAIQDLKNKIQDLRQVTWKLSPVESKLPIYIKVQNGLANRIRVLDSFYNFSHNYNKELFVCWDEGKGWGKEHFLDLFENIEGINFISNNEYEKFAKKYINIDKFINSVPPRYYDLYTPSSELIETVFKKSFCYHGESALKYFFPLTLKHSDLFLNQLVPKEPINDHIEQISSSFDENTIGIHIRRGDAITSPWKKYFELSSDDFFINEMNKEIHKNQKTNFFLSTDCEKTQNKFIEIFKDKIICSKKQFAESKDEKKPKFGQNLAVVDLFCLSNTKKIIGTYWSSFSSLSSTLKNKQILTVSKKIDISQIFPNEQKASVVCAVKDRIDSLLVSLNSWIRVPQIENIIIVDYSSDVPVEPITKNLSNKIKVLRVEDQKFFNISKAYNIAFKNAPNELIMKLDADYILDPYTNFFDIYSIDKQEFLTGSWKDFKIDSDKGFMRQLNGFLLIKKTDFFAVGGYDENMEGYGFDDEDLYKRLSAAGLRRKYLNHKWLSIFHIPHDDYYRTQNYENKYLNDSLLKNKKIHCDKEQKIKLEYSELNAKFISFNNFKSDNKIVVFTQFFNSTTEVASNNTYCLHKNLSNPLIDEVVLFVESNCDFKNTFNSKLTVVKISERLSYEYWYEYSKKKYPKDIKVLSNSDIFFDETIGVLKNIDNWNKDILFVSSRKDISKNGDLLESRECYNDDSICIEPELSQDCWIFKNDLEHFDKNYILGYFNCESKLRLAASSQDVKVVNLFEHINCIHLDWRVDKVRPSY